VDLADLGGSAARALLAKKSRTLLSLFGMSIGVAAVVVLAGLGEGARAWVRAQFEIIGTDVIGILPGKVETTGGFPGFGGVPNDLTLADAEAIRRAVPQAANVAPISFGNDVASAGDRSRRVLVFGCTPEVVPVRKLEVRAGRFLSEGPWDQVGSEVVIGAGLAQELFGTETPVGQRLRVGGWRMRIVGVLENQGVHFGMDMDETVMVPVATAMRMFDQSSLFRIAVQLRPGADEERAQERILALLIERHGEEDVTLTTPDAILTALEGVLLALTLGLMGIASISLAVAGIGVMNVMLVAVSERTSEVGLLNALGATRGQVLSLFLAEAALLSALGGVVGVGLGWAALAAGSARVAALPPTPPTWSAVAGIGVAVGCGLVFGLLPAARAVRLDPVAALEGRAR
jgi:putative ABC transport system permease protein